MARRGWVAAFSHAGCLGQTADVEMVTVSGFVVTNIYTCRVCGFTDDVPVGEPEARQRILDEAMAKMVEQGILDELEGL